MGFSEWVHYENCMVMRITDAAICFRYQARDYWVPKSQLAGGCAVNRVGVAGVTISITEWIREKNNIPIPDDE